MSARKINNNNQGDNLWEDEITSKDLLKIGFHNFNLTNIDNDYEPKIQAGSAVEVGGYVYVWDYETDILGDDISDFSGVVYIRTDITDDVLIAVYDTTSELPEWDRERKGYYDENDNKFLASFISISSQDRHINKQYLVEEVKEKNYLRNKVMIHDGAFCQVHDVTYGNGMFHLLVSTEKEYGNVFILRTIDGESYEELYKSPDNTSTSYNTYGGRISIANGAVFAHIQMYGVNLNVCAVDGINFIDTGFTDRTMLTGGNQIDTEIFVYNNGVYAYACESKVYYSSDCITWNSITVGHQYNAITISGDRFIVWNWLGYQIYTSTDCTSFTQTSSPTSGSYCYIFSSGIFTMIITDQSTLRTTSFTAYLNYDTIPTNTSFTAISTSDRILASCQESSDSKLYEFKDCYSDTAPSWIQILDNEATPYYDLFSNGKDYGFCSKNTNNINYSVYINQPNKTSDVWSLFCEFVKEDTRVKTVLGNGYGLVYGQGEKYLVIVGM